MTVNEFYQKVDGDYTDAINRLQSDVLIRKFLKMLPGDNSIWQRQWKNPRWSRHFVRCIR